MTEEEREKFIRRALAKLKHGSQLPEPEPELKPKGVTVADVLAVFPGARIVSENGQTMDDPPANGLRCEDCDKLHIPEWRRGGKIIERKWPDGRTELACHYCGRSVNGQT